MGAGPNDSIKPITRPYALTRMVGPGKLMFSELLSFLVKCPRDIKPWDKVQPGYDAPPRPKERYPFISTPLR